MTLHRKPAIIVSIVAIILLIPLVAMQFTDQVNWDSIDFVAGAIILLAAIGSLSLAISKIKNMRTRLITAWMIVLTFVLVWAELAVGIFGTPFAGN